MRSNGLAAVLPARHQALELAQVERFPTLAEVLLVWRAACGTDLPRRIDPLELPTRVFPYVILLEFAEASRTLRIRLAGEFVRQKHGSRLVGLTPYDVFELDEARRVSEDAAEAAQRREAHLAYSASVGVRGTYWSYVRLLLPLATTEGAVDRIFKVIEPTEAAPT
jgi:hypothetical protein